MKKVITLLLVAAMCLALVACGAQSAGNDSSANSNTDAAPAVDAAPVEEAANTVENLKIGAFSNSSKEDGAYTYAFYRDLVAVAESFGMDVDKQVIFVENLYDGTPDVANVIQMLINEGCNMIIAHSNGYLEEMATYAEQYPDVRFYCYEGMNSDVVNPYTINNMEVMYILGYLCAAMSEGNDIGFIAPMQNSHIIRSMDAFAIGAKEYNADAKVNVMWVNSWHDPETDKLCAETLLGQGMNCIAYYGSTATALQACEENGAFCTGFHTDRHDAAPNAVMTSYMWNWQPIITEMVERYLAGDMENVMISGNMSTGCATMAELNADIVPAEVIELVNAMKDKAVNGEIDVFAGPLYDNQGNEVVAEGSTITEEELPTIMFLVDNVVGNLD